MDGGSKGGSKSVKLGAMVYRKTPSYLWQNRTGLYHFKLGIPASLQQYYPDERTGKQKSHIVVSLESHSHAIAEKRKLPLLLKYKAEFERLTSEATGKPDSALMLKVRRIRQDRAKLAETPASQWTDDHEGLDIGLGLETETTYHQVKETLGEDAAERALSKMVHPNRTTVTEGLTSLMKSSGKSEGTLSSYKMAVSEVLEFMGASDCYPNEVTDAVALRYVDKLNEGPLSVSAKNTRLSALRALWKHMNKREGWKRDPWQGHALTKPRKTVMEGGAGGDQPIEVRPFTDEEVVRLFTLEAPQDNRTRKYTRQLFRELYAMGLVTGMRLNEIASLRRRDVSKLDESWRVLTVRRQVGKTAAAERQLPVCHPVALSIIDARLREGGSPDALLFHECTPEKQEQKPGKKVGDAMSNERMHVMKLIPREVDFHSTRRNFATLLEQQCKADAQAQLRYFGHDVPTLMHKVYSGGAGVTKLKTVVQDLSYPPEVEEAMLFAMSTTTE